MPPFHAIRYWNIFPAHSLDDDLIFHYELIVHFLSQGSEQGKDKDQANEQDYWQQKEIIKCQGRAKNRRIHERIKHYDIKSEESEKHDADSYQYPIRDKALASRAGCLPVGAVLTIICLALRAPGQHFRKTIFSTAFRTNHSRLHSRMQDGLIE